MLQKVKKLCLENDVELLYLTKFGSHLYGTNTPESDTDYKGIFLPSKQQCFTQTAPKNLNFSTGSDSTRNTSEDVDVQLWSLQYFLQLVSKGETNALDLLFSFTNHDMVVFESYHQSVMKNIFSHHNLLFDIKNCNAYVGYAIGQAKKYGIKGSRLGVLKNVLRFVEILLDINPDLRLDESIGLILAKYFDSSYCFSKELGGKLCLVLCGKVHQGTIKLSELYERLKRDYGKYGHRAELAEKNQGIDWKALSHAVRSLSQMKQLIKTGMIRYPLDNAPELTAIKRGKMGFFDVEKRIYDDIADVDAMLNDENLEVFNHRNDVFIRTVIMQAYGIEAI